MEVSFEPTSTLSAPGYDHLVNKGPASEVHKSPKSKPGFGAHRARS